MTEILCDLCKEHYDFRLLRCYQYTSIPDGEQEVYCACEDYVVHEKRFRRNLGEEIFFQKQNAL